VKKPSLKVSNVSSWYKSQKQKRKEKEEQERNLEPSSLKMFTFAITLVAMAVGMSVLPLFPQPLPIFLAVLVAFITFKIPRVGMPIGGVIIGLGLMYQLSLLSFISFLGDFQVRVAFLVVWMALFVVAPAIFNRYKSALAVDFGILAVASLFVGPIYFMAIPLILASAVFFKKYVSLTVIYYVLLSVPLQIMQYYQYTVLPIVRSDWWLEPGSSPPLLVPLTSIGRDLTATMTQFRLYDLSNVLNSIAGQTTWTPNWAGRTINAAVTQYRDSIPGILMFAVIVVGLALTLMFFTRFIIKEGIIGSGDKFFQIFTATLAAAIFFILISSLQVPLAFTADVSPITMILGIFATVLLTLPVMFVDTTPKQTTSFSELKEKAELLKEKLGIFQAQIENVKENIPVIVAVPEGQALVIKDSLDEMLKRIALRELDQSELDKKFAELNQLSKDKDAAEAELNKILSEYQILATCQFSDWVGKFKAEDINIKTILSGTYQNEMPLEERILAIKQVLDNGRALAKEVIAIVDPIYSIIRPLYDPALPEKCRSVQFANDKLQKIEAPWIAVEALYNSLNNWKRQYSVEIQMSMRYLKNSLEPIANLTLKSDTLPSAFGDNTFKVLDYSKKAESMKAAAAIRAGKEKADMLDIVALKNDVEGFISMSSDILLMLYSGLVNDEEILDRLLPTKDYLWEKNSNLTDRLKKATEILASTSNYQINQILESLPKYLSYIDEGVETLAVYSERKEFLLNYPLAEAAIQEQLKIKEKLEPKDLPFQQKFAAEYLRLYYSSRYGDYAFDKNTLVLTKR
jgi:hypothetical protein